MATTESMHDVLRKWSSCPGELNIPKESPLAITRLHIYDFDNTLYKSPRPNRTLYTNKSYWKLFNESNFGNCSWWNESRFLEQSFVESIANTQFRNYWNEKIVKLAEKSYEDEKTVSIVLTGRKEAFFATLIERMLNVEKKFRLERQQNEHETGTLLFNAVCLKKKDSQDNYPSTNTYKIQCISELIEYYPNLSDVTIYDDRLPQIQLFKNFFKNIKSRPKLQWFVIPVPPEFFYLDTASEYKLVQKIIDEHNLQINDPLNQLSLKWTPKHTGFFLSLKSQSILLKLGFMVLKNTSAKKIDNLSEYPMYIPLCKPGNTLSPSAIANIYTNIGNNVDVTTALHSYHNSPVPGTRNRVEFIATHYIIIKNSPVSNGTNVYFRVEPKHEKKVIKKIFDIDTPLIITGHMMDTADDQAIQYWFTQEYMEENRMRWIPLRKAVRISTTFGHFSKMKF